MSIKGRLASHDACSSDLKKDLFEAALRLRVSTSHCLRAHERHEMKVWQNMPGTRYDDSNSDDWALKYPLVS